MSATLTYIDFLTKNAILKIAGVLLAVLLIAAAVRAQTVETGATAGSMLEMCKAQTDTAAGAASWALCEGRVQGWMTAHYMSVLAYGGAGKRLFCEPSDWTVKQLTAAYVEWGAAHPELLSLSWNNGLMRALQEAFPCSR
jgi:hypothetical protein